MNVYTVYLRQPAGMDDRRCDPFWEFGSFGSTGCHSSNLLHPRHSPLTAGDRLVFLQGSSGEVRAIAMTPPIRVGGNSARLEALWDPAYRPIPYAHAPLFIDNSGRTDFPSLLAMLKGVKRDTPCSAVGSKFRSRCTALDKPLAMEILTWFEGPRGRANAYFDAICHAGNPWLNHASRSGWANPAVRSQRYVEFGGTLSFNEHSKSSEETSSCFLAHTVVDKPCSSPKPKPQPSPELGAKSASPPRKCR